MNVSKKSVSMILLSGLLLAGLTACDNDDRKRKDQCKPKTSQALIVPEAVDAKGGGGGGRGGGGGGRGGGSGSSSKSGSSTSKSSGSTTNSGPSWFFFGGNGGSGSSNC